MSESFVGSSLFDRWVEGESMAEIARDVGTSRERVRQLIESYSPRRPVDDPALNGQDADFKRRYMSADDSTRTASTEPT